MKRYAIQTWMTDLGQFYRLFDRETNEVGAGLHSFSVSGGVDSWLDGDGVRVYGPDSPVTVVVETSRPVGWPGFETHNTPYPLAPWQLIVCTSQVDGSLIDYETIEPP